MKETLQFKRRNYLEVTRHEFEHLVHKCKFLNVIGIGDDDDPITGLSG